MVHREVFTSQGLHMGGGHPSNFYVKSFFYQSTRIWYKCGYMLHRYGLVANIDYLIQITILIPYTVQSIWLILLYCRCPGRYLVQIIRLLPDIDRIW